MVKNSTNTFRSAFFYRLTQLKIDLILLVFVVIALLIYYIISIPRPKPLDPLSPESYPSIFQRIKTFDYSRVSAYDVDGDGISEWMGFRSRYADIDKNIVSNSIHLNRINNDQLEQFNVRGVITPPGKVWFRDINNDGENDIIFGETLHDSIFIHIRTLNDVPISKFFAVTKDQFTKPLPEWNCFVHLLDLIDVNDDGREDMITCVFTPEAGSPRGIYAFDYVTCENLWVYEMGAGLNQDPVVADIDNDGRNEIMFGTTSFGNVFTPRNGTDDYHNYFFVSNLEGQIQFKHEFNDTLGMSVLQRAADLTGDGQLEIIVLHNIHQRERTTLKESTFYFYDPSMNRLIRQFPLAKAIRGLLVSDSDNDGKDELIFTDMSGKTYIYKYDDLGGNFFWDDDFSLPENLNFTSVSIWTVVDLNNDGYNEFIVGSKELWVVLDQQHEMKAVIEAPDGEPFILNDGLSKKKLLYPKGDSSYLLELKDNPAYYIKKAGHYTLTWPIVLIIVSISFLVAAIRRNAKNEALGFDKGVIKFNNENQIVFLSKHAYQLLGLPSQSINPQKLNRFIGNENVESLMAGLQELDEGNRPVINEEIMIPHGDRKRRLHVQIQQSVNKRGLVKGKLLILSDLMDTISSDHVLTWGIMAQQLAHEIKNPLSAILLNLKRIHQGINNDKYYKYFDVITSEIERLRNATDAFMKFSDSSRMNIQLCDINEIITQSLKELDIDAHGKLKVSIKPEKGEFRIRSDQEMIHLAVTNIIHNSMESITDQGEINIYIRNIERIDDASKVIKPFVQIEVMDTGMGIKQSHLDKILKAGFTTKSGGAGFGLSIANHIIQSHNGYLQISSEEGCGTVVVLDLPSE